MHHSVEKREIHQKIFREITYLVISSKTFAFTTFLSKKCGSKFVIFTVCAPVAAQARKSYTHFKGYKTPQKCKILGLLHFHVTISEI